MGKKLTPLPEPRADCLTFDHQKAGKSFFQTFSMTDLRKLVLAVSVLSSLTVVLQLASQILSLYLLQLQRRQDFLKENVFVSRGRQKHCGQRKARASWKKPGLLTDGGLTFGKGIFPKMNGSITFVCLERSLSNLSRN